MPDFAPGLNICLAAGLPGGGSTFVEIEDDNGHSVTIGNVTHSPNGEWTIRITADDISSLRPVAEPNACRHCNIPERGHGGQWSETVGWHTHVEPTDGQRLTRMRARSAARVVDYSASPSIGEIRAVLDAGCDDSDGCWDCVARLRRIRAIVGIPAPCGVNCE